MKRFRKFTALLMAMVMVLAMGVTSFAAENTTYTIPVEYDSDFDGTADKTVYVTLNEDGSYVDSNGNSHKYTQSSGHSIENYDKATAFDALYATGLLDDYYAVEYLDTTTWQGTGVYGMAFNTFNGMSGGSVTDDETGVTTYTYWNLQIKEKNSDSYVSSDNYATHSLASDIDGVRVVFTSMEY